MWVFTKYGFYSAVAKPNPNPDGFPLVTIRARRRAHLENLRKRFPKIGRIQETPESDYRWRVTCRQSVWAGVLKRLGDAIDYGNFKQSVAETNDSEYHEALHEIWLVMWSLQNSGFAHIRESHPNRRDTPQPGGNVRKHPLYDFDNKPIDGQES